MQCSSRRSTIAPSIILADHVLPGFDGDAASALARERIPPRLSSSSPAPLTEELAVQALTRGARDYVVKQRAACRMPSVAHGRKPTSATSWCRRRLRSREPAQLQVTDAVPAPDRPARQGPRCRFANKAFLDWHGEPGIAGTPCRDVSAASAPFERAPPSLERVRGERTSFQVELVHRSGQSCRWTCRSTPMAAWPTS